MSRPTSFDKLSTWEPFAFPEAPQKRLIKTGKRTYSPDGSPGTIYSIGRTNRKVVRKPFGGNPPDDIEEMAEGFVQDLLHEEEGDLDNLFNTYDLFSLDSEDQRQFVDAAMEEFGKRLFLFIKRRG